MLFSSRVPQNAAPVNRFAGWVYALMAALIVLAVIYALPMLYGDSPSVQLTPKENVVFTDNTVRAWTAGLTAAGAVPTATEFSADALQFKFRTSEDQLKAYDWLSGQEGKVATVALNLSPNTPKWLRALGASPMKLGLDLQGGMYFLLDVDTPAVVQNELKNYAQQLRDSLRTERIRYAGIDVMDDVIVLKFRDAAVMAKAKTYAVSHFSELQVAPGSDASDSGKLAFRLQLTPTAQQQIESYAVTQTVNVMRNRVNELGVAEASVAQEGLNRVVIELPGLQDAARAKEIIGGTSTLKVMMVNESADVADALAGHVPSGSVLVADAQQRPVVLFDSVVLTGKSVVGATAGFDSQTSQPIVGVTLSGADVSRFSDVTAANVGHLMAIVRVDQSFTQQTVNGKVVTHTQEKDTVISVANILQRLDNRFQITGLSAREAQTLALSIRAGALPAPVQIVEEKHIGPSLGAENIRMGAISVVVAMALVMLFMAIYYHLFGLIADIGLCLNLILIVAIMAIMPGATLTLPGIAGIVLNVGMAIDANVLIFERIREELRNGSSTQSAIYAGYDRAFSTIVDSNMTTLIVAIILFSLGSGAVKGFAVTLMIGIVTSLFTALGVCRGLVNLCYGSRSVKSLSIGIRLEKSTSKEGK